MGTELIEGIPTFLDRKPFVGTFTILAAYGNCEHQMFRTYIKKDQPYEETKERAWGNAVHAAMQKRVGSRVPLPLEMQKWEPIAASFDGLVPSCEQRLGVTRDRQPTGFYDKDVWFRGLADLTLVQNTNAYLLDYKTGSSRYEDPFELETQAMLLHAKHPQLTRIAGSYAWLKEDRIGQLFNLSDTNSTWRRVTKLMNEIEAKRETANWDWIKRKSGLCPWCSVRDCENWRERK